VCRVQVAAVSGAPVVAVVRDGRSNGKQPGAAGVNLSWTDSPDQRTDRFPEGRCECGHDLVNARDLRVIDRYQQHEIPPGQCEGHPV
jgi:hypothetical protein